MPQTSTAGSLSSKDDPGRVSFKGYKECDRVMRWERSRAAKVRAQKEVYKLGAFLQQYETSVEYSQMREGGEELGEAQKQKKRKERCGSRSDKPWSDW